MLIVKPRFPGSVLSYVFRELNLLSLLNLTCSSTIPNCVPKQEVVPLGLYMGMNIPDT